MNTQNSNPFSTQNQKTTENALRTREQIPSKSPSPTTIDIENTPRMKGLLKIVNAHELADKQHAEPTYDIKNQSKDPLENLGTFTLNPENENMLKKVCENVQTNNTSQKALELCNQINPNLSVQKRFNDICAEIHTKCGNIKTPECDICTTHSTLIQLGGRKYTKPKRS
jgi:hypothetical protein